MIERYAVYYTPPRDSDLRRLAGQWLGYDPYEGRCSRPEGTFALDGAFLDELIGKPRIYGFHATLKPPFRLSKGQGEAALQEAVARLASQFKAFPLPRLELSHLGGFLALLPKDPEPRLGGIAASCVEQLDEFRAEPRPDELARRREASLSPRQKDLLQLWGYPYVFDEFRFHMTLTRSLDEHERACVEPLLARVLEPVLSYPLVFDALSLMHQAGEAEPFTEIERVPLSGAGD